MPKKKTTKRSKVTKKTTQKIEIVVKQPNTAITVAPKTVLEPIKEGGRFMMVKTWLSDKQSLKLLQRTPKEYIYTRPAKGGGTWDYVPGAYVQKVLNFVFGWNWDFEILKQEIVGNQVVTLGKLTVKDDNGHTITKTQNGRADIKHLKNSKEYLDIGNDYKASSTDCLKKCASMIGIASDIYGKQEFREAGIAVQNDKPVQTSQEVKKTAVNQPPIIEAECNECANSITKQEAEFSKRMFKKPLCRDCQNIIKNQDKL